MERILVGVDRPTREKVPSGTLCGFRARLHQLGEMLTPRGTKSSNPASSSGESVSERNEPAEVEKLGVSRECAGHVWRRSRAETGIAGRHGTTGD